MFPEGADQGSKVRRVTREDVPDLGLLSTREHGGGYRSRRGGAWARARLRLDRGDVPVESPRSILN